ncbi:alcohol dehydrogenase-like 2 [Gossypium australe]|uniref:Alcohol dehydrogenase-like 2 n=1 Tax=Gossypium australe TaxID=47621 RepID=A0A5B6WKC9_9ROSI|nr:alcohol dehydrogenase-like 2 [Gossypium australe]
MTTTPSTKPSLFIFFSTLKKRSTLKHPQPPYCPQPYFAYLLQFSASLGWGKGEPLKVEEIQVEPPKSYEVRVKMLYAGVCHTDLLFANGFLTVSTLLLLLLNLII